METTLYLQNGYKLHSKDLRPFRPMTLDEIKRLRRGQRVWFRANDGTARQITVNGQVQTWKTNAARVSVPVKYGLYETSRWETDECLNRFLVRTDE